MRIRQRLGSAEIEAEWKLNLLSFNISGVLWFEVSDFLLLVLAFASSISFPSSPFPSPLHPRAIP